MSPFSSFLTLTPPEQRFFLASWLLAAPITAGLRLTGFRRMTHALQHLPRRRSADSKIDAQRGDQLTLRAFRWSLARWSASDVDGCLPRSMVQYVVHSLRGDDVRLHIGIAPERRDGFEAHAWVEDRGAPRPDIDHAVIFELEPR